MKLNLTCLYVLLLMLLFNGCKKDETLKIEEEIKSNTWTQKIGFLNEVDLGSIKIIYQMTFNEDGYCHMIWDRWIGGIPLDGDTLPSELDTLNIRYAIESNKILFPESFDEWIVTINGTTDTLDAYFNDYEIISFEKNLIHLKYIVKLDSGMACFGPKEMYLEPLPQRSLRTAL